MTITVEATVETSVEKTEVQVKSVDEDANTTNESETTEVPGNTSGQPSCSMS